MSALGLLLLQAVVVTVVPLDTPPVPDSVLADLRGGFRLPNGIDVALTVQTQTSIDGAIVLRTVFRADQGTPTLSVFAPRNGERIASASSPVGSAEAGATAPSITFDSRNGIHVTPGLAGPAISVSGSSQAPAAIPDGLTQVAPGAPVSTDNGVITQSTQNAVQTVRLDSADLTVTHLAGNAFGSAIANSGSDRAIDTQTSVSLDLRNAGPDVLGSAMFRVDNIATDALSSRLR